jgi:hypothetical protein
MHDDRKFSASATVAFFRPARLTSRIAQLFRAAQPRGPSKGLTWVYFLSPWGMRLELVSYPTGIAVPHHNPVALWDP